MFSFCLFFSYFLFILHAEQTQQLSESQKKFPESLRETYDFREPWNSPFILGRKKYLLSSICNAFSYLLLNFSLRSRTSEFLNAISKKPYHSRYRNAAILCRMTIHFKSSFFASGVDKRGALVNSQRLREEQIPRDRKRNQGTVGGRQRSRDRFGLSLGLDLTLNFKSSFRTVSSDFSALAIYSTNFFAFLSFISSTLYVTQKPL